LYEGQPDSVSTVLSHENGTVSTLSQTIVSHVSRYDFHFIGSLGSILLNGRTVTLNGEGPGTEFPVGESLREEIHEFATCCLDSKTPDANGESVRHTVAIVEAARLSAARDEVVMVSELG
jgi:predicted dehydrogenase